LKLELHKPLVSQIHDVLEKTSAKLDKKQSFQPLPATYTTIDRCKTTIDLNVCRPLASSTFRQVEKKKYEEESNLEDLLIV
jgi:hypothetical protein